MANLIIDAGNTRLKTAHFEQSKITKEQTFDSLEELSKMLENIPGPTQIITSNVGKWQWGDIFKPFSKHVELNHLTPLPLEITYGTPDTLGFDRRALAVAAHQEFPDLDTLIVDVGTCITYDCVDKERGFVGGGIAPGLSMRFKALHEFTANLPLVKYQGGEVELIGDNTEKSIITGVVNGFKAEVEKTIETYYSRYYNLNIVLTGGDANLFVHLTKNGIFARPKFLLTGLNHILEYNA